MKNALTEIWRPVHIQFKIRAPLLSKIFKKAVKPDREARPEAQHQQGPSTIQCLLYDQFLES